MQKLRDKVAVITGASSGIGYATAKTFKEHGATVFITAENREAITKAADELGVIGLESDASNLASISQLYEEIRKRVNGIDVLFLNAGVAQFNPIEMVSEEIYDKMFDLNVKGVYFNIQKALPLLPSGSTIILNSSALSAKGASTTSVYAATKAAVRSLARSLSSELLPKNIRVNAIAPGPIKTSLFEKLDLPKGTIDQIEVFFAESTPMKRFGTLEEVTGPALFLASSDSTYITGIELAIDGGLTQL